MQTKHILMGIVSVLIVILSVLMIVVLQNDRELFEVGESPTVLENCKSIGSISTGINLLFFADEATTQEYADYFFSSSPFDKHLDNFNIFYIEPSDYDPECELYKGAALFCDSKELIKKAASCPNDYLIVLEDHPEVIRSSSYKQVISIVTAHPKEVLLHEIGHALAGFAEEYVDNNAKVPRGSENCKKSCEDFGTESCSLGCTKSDLYRFIPEGVMRTLNTGNFGSYNENLINERVEDELKTSSFFTGNVVSEISEECLNQEYYLIGIESGEIVSVIEEIGCAGTPGHGSNNVQIKTADGIISSESFSNEIIFTARPGNENEIDGVQYDSKDLLTYLKVPKIDDAELIQIVNFDGEVTGSFPVESVGYYPVKQ
ncbi:hypothetical protein HN604_03555 [archaeon]|jgi:hypothetical protein|nr:hypothetical protein [archaeon]MBT6182894.1 hypothetical protein [archaeon]MBT6606616.1 hypothetical protein [archaeon]MBT7251859.1 hypothetical protein [archaeon]MBT7661129.1 hypothetical protein [archaeon]